MPTDELTQYGDLLFPQCDGCVHLRANRVCKAFPNGIPEEIWDNVVDHREPYPGDHEIRWESKFDDDQNLLDHLSLRSERFLSENNLLASLAIKRKREANERELQSA